MGGKKLPVPCGIRFESAGHPEIVLCEEPVIMVLCGACLLHSLRTFALLLYVYGVCKVKNRKSGSGNSPVSGNKREERNLPNALEKIMKFPAFLFILLLICVISCGCTQAPAPAVPLQTVAATSPATPSPGIPAIALSPGTPNATFPLDPGVVVVLFRTDSDGRMDFYFSNQSQGYGEGTSFVTSGPYAGSVAFQAPVKDTYQLAVSGNGNWTGKTVPLVTTDPEKAPVNLSGSGTVVTPVFFLEKGEYFFQRNETGIASPIYQLQFANGSPLMDANNTHVQPFFGELSPHPFIFVTIPENGTYFLSALCRYNPGNWSASIRAVPPIPHMGPGPAMPGRV
jgi:hypothetical protein